MKKQEIEIQFCKQHTKVAIKWLLRSIGIIARAENLPRDVEELVSDLSMVLVVLRRCHESAPEIATEPVTQTPAEYAAEHPYQENAQ
jgi:hypothetical protein